jgi:5-methylcytosine-specific restriction endonuclease McrA
MSGRSHPLHCPRAEGRRSAVASVHGPSWGYQPRKAPGGAGLGARVDRIATMTTDVRPWRPFPHSAALRHRVTVAPRHGTGWRYRSCKASRSACIGLFLAREAVIERKASPPSRKGHEGIEQPHRKGRQGREDNAKSRATERSWAHYRSSQEPRREDNVKHPVWRRNVTRCVSCMPPLARLFAALSL